MSEGPIKAWRDSWKPQDVSTNPKTAIHLKGERRMAYCGRGRVTLSASPSAVTCADCLAAKRADESR